LTAAPLEKAMTALPGSGGSSSASRVQLNTCCTSTSQLRLKVGQVCRWIGHVRGAAPALRTSVRGAVFVEELARDHGVGGDGGEGAAELCVQFLAPAGVAGDPGDVGAVLGQGDGDGAAETPAGAGDQCRRSGKFLRWHAGLP